jgi:class 3 adenylate cyclase
MNDLASWLRTLGLSAYEQAFASQHIGIDLLKDLSDADLKELGITSLGHRKQLMRAIAELEVSSATSSAVLAPPTVRPIPKAAAERRQLSVMFCDLVGSTVLSEQLDPEDLQRVIRGYHDAVTHSVAPYEGYVAQA